MVVGPVSSGGAPSSVRSWRSLFRWPDRIGFLDEIGVGVVSGNFQRFELDVGLDTLGLDGAAVRGVVACRGQFDRRAVAQGQNGLYRALAEGALTQNQRSAVIFSAPATISEADAEPPLTSTTSGAPFSKSPGVAFEALVGAVAATLGLDDGAIFKEIVRHIHRAVQHPARVVAQVQHQSSQRFLFCCSSSCSACSRFCAVLDWNCVIRR